MTVHAKEYKNDFMPFEGRVWLNSASEGPLPRVSLEALQEAARWKALPYNLTLAKFREVPAGLKKAAARLFQVSAEDMILGNSATYGIHLLAHGLPLEKGDEVLVMQNDFPVDILPWLFLEKKGVRVRQIKPEGFQLTADELEQNITPSTRVVCLSHVHTFSGHVLDVIKVGALCKEKGIIFVLNVSQSAGCLPVVLGEWPVDAMTTSGFKWLLGPYGTGLCWITPALRERMDCSQAFWANVLTPEEIESTGELALPETAGTSTYDVFGTANFFNFYPLTKSIEYLNGIGLYAIREHNDRLVQQIIDGIDTNRYDLISPRDKDKRSTLVYITHKDRTKNPAIHRRLAAEKIHGALWKGNIRFAPHVFNTNEDIARLLEALNRKESHGYPYSGR